ncbi:MAG: anti-sigma factor family protein [Actinomycetota bacterium]
MNSLPEPDDRLSAYVDDELDANERAVVDDLLARSDAWRDALAEVAWARDAVRSLPARDVPPGFWATAGDERRPAAPIRSRWRRRVLAGAAAAAAAVAILVVPVQTPEPGGDQPSGNGDRTTVRRERSGVRNDDDRNPVERFVDVVLEPFGW